ncbi:C6 zinc finger domain-containing protein [Pleurostoma richardsiae]|uniref:C6 zinc finger domain-containing protein n=1 Tax=Pleurostoma richardsiae TaxID=41990 RepID=A0AA38RGG3_9PEZI|nr:C6 zinc finger domain-containing protein [Pleurostoma richardsiae]
MSSSESRVESEGEPASKKRKRTRSGCLTCRRKKRKCDECRPVCARCSRVGATCEWGVRVTFRPVNSIPSPARSSLSETQEQRRFDVLDLTDSVVREYQSRPADDQGRTRVDQHDVPLARSSLSTAVPDHRFLQSWSLESVPSTAPDCVRTGFQPEARSSSNQCSNAATPLSQQTEHAAVHLLSLRQTVPVTPSPAIAPDPVETVPGANLTTTDQFEPDFAEYPALDDGLFLPGSAYLDLHSVLRNHLIREGRSNGPTRCATPTTNHVDEPSLASATQLSQSTPFALGREIIAEDDPALAVTEEQEYLLWVNWLEEVATWLDKFDHEKHFQHTLSLEAKSHPYLKYAIMAVSARQMERRGVLGKAVPSSLAFYQQAIHLLLPQLATRCTLVIASCVVLCVLEMLSCSPKAWRRHLDGCATLLQAVGIHGFSGGLEQALFWCFARMDVCGGLISSTKTLIPVSSWTPHGGDLRAAVHLFRSSAASDMHANQVIFLAAHVVDLLADIRADTTPGVFARMSPHHDTFIRRWTELWDFIEEWYMLRPEEMHPVFTASGSGSFPTILFSNPAAISGNQMYHTAALLMLQHRPPQIVLHPKPRPILWHARRIVGISNSNTHHGCWTNSLQPLWVAGRLFSSPEEHRTILALLERIEQESGWATKWRADDLREWWGDLED